MDRNQTRLARQFAHDLTDALSAQITMHMRGVTADSPAAAVATENANDALENAARTMGFKLVALVAVREGSDQLEGVAAE